MGNSKLLDKLVKGDKELLDELNSLNIKTKDIGVLRSGKKLNTNEDKYHISPKMGISSV